MTLFLIISLLFVCSIAQHSCEYSFKDSAFEIKEIEISDGIHFISFDGTDFKYSCMGEKNCPFSLKKPWWWWVPFLKYDSWFAHKEKKIMIFRTPNVFLDSLDTKNCNNTHLTSTTGLNIIIKKTSMDLTRTDKESQWQYGNIIITGPFCSARKISSVENTKELRLETSGVDEKQQFEVFNSDLLSLSCNASKVYFYCHSIPLIELNKKTESKGNLIIESNVNIYQIYEPIEDNILE